MATSITEIEAGDYIKVGPQLYREVASVYGVREDGRLAKPSEGFIGVHTVDGDKVSGWDIFAYVKRADLPPGATVVR